MEPSVKDLVVTVSYGDSDITGSIVNIKTTSSALSVKYAVTRNNKKPNDNEYKAMQQNIDGYSAQLTFTQNDVYYIWIKDSNGKIISKKVVIDNLDKTKPTCKFKTTGYVGIGGNSKISLVCTDIVDIEEKYLLKSDFKISNEDVIDSFDISAPTKIDNGYEWFISMSVKKVGNFKISLLENSISDKVGNKNSEVTSDDIKISELVLNSDSSVSLDISGNNTHTIRTSGTNIGSLSYSSSDDSIAKVSSAGVITGVSPGVAKIIVKENNGGDYRTIDVNVSRTLTATFNKPSVGVDSISSTVLSCTILGTSNKEEQETSCKIKLPMINTKEGYTAIGWNEDKNAITGLSPNTEIELTGNKEFYGIIKKDAITLSATFYRNGAKSLDGDTSEYVKKSCVLEEKYNGEAQKEECEVITPTIEASENTPNVVGYSEEQDSIIADLEPNTTIKLNGNKEYYAITKSEMKTITATFYKNGSESLDNSKENYITKICNILGTYNGKAQEESCKITSPLIEASKNTPVVIGYSKDQENHQSEWDSNTEKNISESSNYYAQTKKEKVTYTATYKVGKNVVSVEREKDSCEIPEVYNGNTQNKSCNIEGGEITPKTGYTSVGYSEENGSTTGNTTLELTSDKTYYANAVANSYTVEYYNGSTKLGESGVKVDEELTLPTITSLNGEKEGYSFKGWTKTNGSETVEYTDGETVTNLATKEGEVVKLYAVYKDDIKPVCTFSNTKEIYVTEEDTIDLTCTDLGSKIKNTTLQVSNFETSNDNGSIVSVSTPVEIENGYKYSITVKGLKAGTTETTNGSFTISLKENSILDNTENGNIKTTSEEEKVKGYTYTVTFSKGSNVSAISSTSSSCTTTGSSLTCTITTYPTITATTGYSATTWYDSTAKKDTGIASGGSGGGYAIEQDTTMTAQAKANTYKIYFSANGGTGAPDPITRTYGQDVTFPTTVPTKTGYTFNGWLYYGTGDSSSTATSTATKGTYMPGGLSPSSCTDCIPWEASDATYVAIWKINTHTVTYDFNEMNDMNNWLYQYGERFNKSYDATTKMTDIKVNSSDGWEIVYIPITTTIGKEYTLSFDYQVPTAYTPLSGYTGVAYQILSSSPNVESGSNSDRQIAVGYIPTVAQTTSKNAKLKFKATTSTTYIAFNFGMAADYVTTEIKFGNFKIDCDTTYGSTIDLESKLQPNGYTQVGWNTDKNATDKLKTLKMEDSDIKLYAIYAKNVYEFDYTGSEQVFKVPVSGTYKLETWGAQGGTSLRNGVLYEDSGYGGYGGYSSGEISLSTNKIIYINVGGRGKDGVASVIQSLGGYNGGGNGLWDKSDDESTGGGGGATHFALRSGLLSSLENYKSDILTVSGGGGGGAWSFLGGSGGGIRGNMGINTSMDDVTEGYYSIPGTQTNGYLFGKGGEGTLNPGTPGGGGGGGYYGGFGGIITVADAIPGAGGSGYIGNSLLKDKAMYCYNCQESSEESTKTISTTCTSSTPTVNCAKEGNGYAKITLVSVD